MKVKIVVLIQCGPWTWAYNYYSAYSYKVVKLRYIAIIMFNDWLLLLPGSTLNSYALALLKHFSSPRTLSRWDRGVLEKGVTNATIDPIVLIPLIPIIENPFTGSNLRYS